MKPQLHTHLQSTKAPWISLVVTEPGRRPESTIKLPAGFHLVLLRGSKCKTVSALLAEFAKAFDFPEYFGHNWDALEECLTDLEWLPAKGYVVLLSDAELVLTKAEADEWATLVEVLNDAGEAWGTGQAGLGTRRATPFHMLCAVTPAQKSAWSHRGIVELSTERTGKPTAKRPAPASKPSRR